MSSLFSASPRPPAFVWFAGLGLVLALTSCQTTAPAQRSQVATPITWRSATMPAVRDNAALARWWRGLGDATLERLITDALAANPDVRTALSRIAAARAQAGIDRAALFPSLNANGSGSAQRTRNRSSDAVTSTQSAGASLDASWQLDLFGQQRATARAATADVAEAEANWHGAQASLAAEIATAYVTLRSNEEQLAVVNESLKLQSSTAQIAEWREQSGNASALDTQQSHSALEQARASVPELQQTIAHARNQLAVLCGRQPGALDDFLAQQSEVPLFREDLAAGIPAETLRQRPDIAAAQHRVEAAQARLSAQERARFPSLSLNGSLGVDALKAGKLFSPTSVVSSVAGSLTAPLFSADRISQQIAVQNENARQALIAYESAVLTALQEVENALVTVQRTSERGAILARATAAAQTAANLASQQYAAGQTDLLTVLDAQRSYLSLQQQFIVNIAAQTTAGIQLYNALGGGWSS